MDFHQSGTLGALVRLARQQRGWTLRQMSEKVGIPLSTLGKVETDKLSLSYDKLQQFTSRLGLSMAEFLAQSSGTGPGQGPQVLTGRKSVTAVENTIRIPTPNYDYEYLCADLREKRMVPIIATIRSHSLEEFGEPVRHSGEEFIFVLEGTVVVHTQFYNPITLNQGQGIYIDSSMAHAYIAQDCESAKVLAMCSGDDPDLLSELIDLAESAGK